MSRRSFQPCSHLFFPTPEYSGPMSPVVRHSCPTGSAQSQGWFWPHSHRLNTIGLPAAWRASLMIR